MPARQPRPRAASEPDTGRALTKAEACKVLQVAPGADQELITKAYWHQAREARAFARRDPEARARLDELNRAYLALNPGKTEAPLSNGELHPPGNDRSFGNEVSEWLHRVVQQTRVRWGDHMPEVTILVATTTALTFLALAAGASSLPTVLIAAAAALAIWAPWRKA